MNDYPTSHPGLDLGKPPQPSSSHRPVAVTPGRPDPIGGEALARWMRGSRGLLSALLALTCWLGTDPLPTGDQPPDKNTWGVMRKSAHASEVAPYLLPENTHALIMAIDEYKAIAPLLGTVNDLRDVTNTMKKLGVKDIVELVNVQVTRQRVLTEMEEILKRAKKGDRVFISYSGHGSQQPERIKGSEKDGLDEIILMAGFAVNKGDKVNRGELILDDEIFEWITKADHQEVDVVMLFDSCHSGTMTRSLDSRTKTTTTRGYPPILDDDLQLSVATSTAAIKDENAAFKNLVSLSGAQENQKVPEISVQMPNQKVEQRGALSYAFSRALEGDADTNKDGYISRKELFTFIRDKVRALAQERQTPNLIASDDENRLLFKVVGSASGQDCPNCAPRVPFADSTNNLAMAIIGKDPPIAKEIISVMKGGEWTDSPQKADITWDTIKQEMVAHGDVVAYGVTHQELQDVINQQRLIDMLRQGVAGASPMAFALTPSDGYHKKGSNVGLRLRELQMPYLILFSLSGNGTLHFHYPLPGDNPKFAADHMNLDFEVTEPLGADHFVAITTQNYLPSLVSQLKIMDNQKVARELPGILRSQLQKVSFQFGLQGLYTKP